MCNPWPNHLEPSKIEPISNYLEPIETISNFCNKDVIEELTFGLKLRRHR